MKKSARKILKVIDDVALESWELQKGLWAEAEKINEEKLLESGNVTITELTEDELAKFREACEPIWYSYEGGKYAELIDQIVAAGE